MRIAPPMVFLALAGAACGGPTPEHTTPSRQAGSGERGAESPHPLIGDWTLRPARGGRSGIRLEVRVDSVARDSAFGALTFYMAGDAGFLTPADWGPLTGVVRGDTVRMTVAAGEHAPEIGLVGPIVGDTVRLTTFRIGSDYYTDPVVLVRTTVSRP